MKELPDNIEDFEQYLSENNFQKDMFAFASDQEKQIVFAWLEFKKEMLLDEIYPTYSTLYKYSFNNKEQVYNYDIEEYESCVKEVFFYVKNH